MCACHVQPLETELNINDSPHASAVSSQESPRFMLEAWIDSELRSLYILEAWIDSELTWKRSTNSEPCDFVFDTGVVGQGRGTM